MDRRTQPYLVLAIFLAGLNLRPALSSVGPLLDAIRADAGLSAGGAGFLTTLPLLCFALFAPLAPRLAQRWGAERVILTGLLALAAAIALRSLGGGAALFAGTVLAGASIGVVMVLLPGIIKQSFGRRAGGMTGVYTLALCLGAALSAGLSVPLQQHSGGSWRLALAWWLIPALLTAILWQPLARRAASAPAAKHQRIRGLYRSWLAWQVTIFMGLQSALAFCIFGWLPTILVEHGLTPVAAGAMLSLSISMQLITALAAPWLAGFGRDQRPAIAAMTLLMVAGFLGCVYANGSRWPWAMMLGLGQGGAFSIAMSLLVLRTAQPAVAAALSGMTQGIGYLLAAAGPFAFGLLRQAQGGWDGAAVLFCAAGLISLGFGLGAGRNGHVKAEIVDA